MTPEAGDSREMSFDHALDLLDCGNVSVDGQIPWSSNSTFLTTVRLRDESVHAVYKPRRGERPLWDFASGTLHYREMAAFVVSEALGWRIVPPTVVRDGPFGPGVLQLFVPHDPEDHYLALDEPDIDAAMRIAAFDVVINNGDRKAGHVLHAEDGRLWAIDHGVSFHVEPKLRTVIWEFAGKQFPGDVMDDLALLADHVSNADTATRRTLDEFLSASEVAALVARIRELLDATVFPEPEDDRWSYPWPPV